MLAPHPSSSLSRTGGARTPRYFFFFFLFLRRLPPTTLTARLLTTHRELKGQSPGCALRRRQARRAGKMICLSFYLLVMIMMVVSCPTSLSLSLSLLSIPRVFPRLRWMCGGRGGEGAVVELPASPLPLHGVPCRHRARSASRRCGDAANATETTPVLAVWRSFFPDTARHGLWGIPPEGRPGSRPGEYAPG